LIDLVRESATRRPRRRGGQALRPDAKDAPPPNPCRPALELSQRTSGGGVRALPPCGGMDREVLVRLAALYRENRRDRRGARAAPARGAREGQRRGALRLAELAEERNALDDAEAPAPRSLVSIAGARRHLVAVGAFAQEGDGREPRGLRAAEAWERWRRGAKEAKVLVERFKLPAKPAKARSTPSTAHSAACSGSSRSESGAAGPGGKLRYRVRVSQTGKVEG